MSRETDPQIRMRKRGETPRGERKTEPEAERYREAVGETQRGQEGRKDGRQRGMAVYLSSQIN